MGKIIFCRCKRRSELIDTLWNVNQKHDGTQGNRIYRINRYIMECKSLYGCLCER